MTTTNRKLVGAKQGRGARSDPPWRRLRMALADIETGMFPARALAYHRLPGTWLDDPRIQSRVRYAEAACQRNAVAILRDAGQDTLKIEYQWQAIAPSQSPPLVITAGDATGAVDATASAPVRARAFPRPGDWKATAYWLERRFPAEYGSQQPAQVAQTVLDVLTALAALRQQPASLEDLRHRPQLPAPATVEAGGTTGTP